MDKDWIDAKEAWETLLRNGENPVSAGETLAGYLRFSDLRARASLVWISEEKELKKAWKPIPEDADRDVELPRTFFRSHKDWARDVSNWRWPTSSFHVTTRMKPRRRRMMRHVQFNLADLKKLQPEIFAGGKKRGKRGPSEDMVKRHLVWGELLKMALAGELTDPAKKEFEGQTELETILYERLNPEGKKATAVGKNVISEVARSAYPKITS